MKATKLAIPALVYISGLLAFLQKWIVERNMKENKYEVAALTIAWLIVVMITVAVNYR